MADRVRLQAIVENNPETWADVGPDGINLPIDVKTSVLPTGAATSDNQTDGSQKTQVTTALINFEFDSVYQTNPDTVTEVYTYKLAGATVATITIIYTDATKETLVSCIRS